MSDAQESTAAAATAAPASPRGPKPPPEGIVPIFLRGVTCEKFGLKTGEGVMDLVNFKYIVRDEILKEVQLMGVMSDFEPAKKHLEAFKGPEILIVVDKDGTYGETFLLCVTEEAQEQFFKIANDKADAEAAKLRAAEDAEAARKAAEWARANAVYEDVPIVPRPWVSATSEETENEINTISHYTPREPIRLEVVRPKRAVNQPYRFLDRNAEVGGIHESRSHKDPHYVYIKENDIAIQAAPILTSSAGQTTWYRPVNKAVQCETSTSTEAVPDDAKDEFLAFLERTVVRVEQALDDCDTVNLFNETFQLTGDEEAGDSSVAENELRELKNFADPNYSKMKMITCIDWMPKANGMVAVNAVRNMSLDQLAHIAGVTYTSYLLVWDFRQLIRPSMLMCSPYEIELFRFNPNAPHLVVGGCATGQVLLWDISETARKSDAKGMNSLFEDADVSSSSSIPIIPKYISSVDHSHKGAVSDIFWLPPTTQINYRGRLVPQEHLDGNSYQFITISFDAQVLVWDIRFELIAQDQLRHIGKMKHIQFEKVDKSHKEGSNGVGRPLWSPVFRAGLKRLEGVGELSLCKVSCSGTLKQSIYSKTQLPGDPRSHLILATEEGDLMFADICGRKAESSAARDDDEEEGGGDASRELLKWMVADHVRPCVALQQSPHFADIVLTVSDMKFNIWKIGDEEPIFSSPLSQSHISCACWSPTRPAVVVLATHDGALHLWDFTDSSSKPSLELKAMHTGITSMEFLKTSSTNAQAQRQQLLAVGDDTGTLHVFEMPRNFVRPVHKEDVIMKKFLDREIKRQQYVKEMAAQEEAARAAAEEAKNAGGAQAATKKPAAAAAAPAPLLKSQSAPAIVMAPGDASAGEMDEAKRIELEALKKEEADFAKLEAMFIAELQLTSSDLPKYAKHMGIDVAVAEEKDAGKKK